MQTLTVSGFVEAAARIVGKYVVSFRAGPRFVSSLRHGPVHNTSLVPTPRDGAPFPGVSWRRGTPLRYVSLGSS